MLRLFFLKKLVSTTKSRRPRRKNIEKQLNIDNFILKLRIFVVNGVEKIRRKCIFE